MCNRNEGERGVTGGREERRERQIPRPDREVAGVLPFAVRGGGKGKQTYVLRHRRFSRGGERRRCEDKRGCVAKFTVWRAAAVRHHQRTAWTTHRTRLHACQNASFTHPKTLLSASRNLVVRPSVPVLPAPAANCLVSIRLFCRVDDWSVGVHVGGQRGYGAIQVEVTRL